jgi:plastocyanin
MNQKRGAALSTTVGALVVIVLILVVAGVIYAGTRGGPTPATSSTTSLALPGSLSSSTVHNETATSSSASLFGIAEASGASVHMTAGAGAGPSGVPGYAPDTITVVIGVNNTVTWTNGDTVSHTVASRSVPSGASSFTSPIIAPGGTYSETFTVAGTYAYYCTLHSWMTGTVVVKSG